MIAFTVVGSFWLEIFLKVRVLARIKRALQAIWPIASIFIIWDAYAIKSSHWRFDKAQVLGIYGPFGIPLEEYLFFFFVPIAAIMTIEAVRTVKKDWPL
ncbi:MAG: lycopene cyclase domain-containing protein [Streptomycetaceae bacterium]|nr:MAG: lycopene cyclase domain-containing protein [Streptomycetaceae bacterium]